MYKTKHAWSKENFNSIQPHVQRTLRVIEVYLFSTTHFLSARFANRAEKDEVDTCILKWYYLLKHFTRYINEKDRTLFGDFCVDVSRCLSSVLHTLNEREGIFNIKFGLNPRYIDLFSKKICSELGFSDDLVTPVDDQGYRWIHFPTDPGHLLDNVIDYGRQTLCKVFDTDVESYTNKQHRQLYIEIYLGSMGLG